MNEVWHDISDFPGYKASNQGRIGSCLTQKGHEKSGRWIITDEIVRVLKSGCGGTSSNYAYVSLCRDGKQHTMRVASLVMLAFHDPPPEGMEICHGNGNPSDNRLCNLRYDTHSANMQESVLVGRSSSGAHARKLTLEQAEAARVEYAKGGISQRVLGQRYGIGHGPFWHLLHGNSYQDAGGPVIGQEGMTRNE